MDLRLRLWGLAAVLAVVGFDLALGRSGGLAGSADRVGLDGGSFLVALQTADLA
jgi:hypothetical protein